MPKYRVSENPYYSTSGRNTPSVWFVGGEVVDVPQDEQPDSEGDYLLLGNQKDPEDYHYISRDCLIPIDDDDDESQAALDAHPEVAAAITDSMNHPECGVPYTPRRRPQPTHIWVEHLADIARALNILAEADKALKESAPEGTPGHWSDLEFRLPPRVPIELGAVDTGWALVYDEDMEGWVFEIGGSDE